MAQYSRQLDVGLNLAFFNPNDHEQNIHIDCSALVEQNIKFVCEQNGVMWVEHDPFTGRVYEFDRDLVESLFEQAQVAWEAKTEYELSLLDVTPTVSSYFGFLTLDNMGYSNAFEQWISEASRTFLQKAYFNHSTLWKRTDEILISAMADIGVDEQKLDELFELAGSM